MLKKILFAIFVLLLFIFSLFGLFRLYNNYTSDTEVIKDRLTTVHITVLNIYAHFQKAVNAAIPYQSEKNEIEKLLTELSKEYAALRSFQSETTKAIAGYVNKCTGFEKKLTAFASMNTRQRNDETINSIESDYSTICNLYGSAVTELQKLDAHNKKLNTIISAVLIIGTWGLGLLLSSHFTQEYLRGKIRRELIEALPDKGKRKVLVIKAGPKTNQRVTSAKTFERVHLPVGDTANEQSTLGTRETDKSTTGAKTFDRVHLPVGDTANEQSTRETRETDKSTASAKTFERVHLPVGDTANEQSTRETCETDKFTASAKTFERVHFPVGDTANEQSTCGTRETDKFTTGAKTFERVHFPVGDTAHEQSTRESLETDKSTTSAKTFAYENLEQKLHDLQNSYRNLQETHASLEQAYDALKSNMEQERQHTSENLEAEAAQVSNLSESFHESKQAFRATQERIAASGKSMSEIQDITVIMSDIAEQIKMLGMNAAIEAAHAGESGKGFAVVAEEMSRLAEAAKENSANISNTVKELVKDINFIANSGGDLEKAFEKLTMSTNSIYQFIGRLREAICHS